MKSNQLVLLLHNSTALFTIVKYRDLTLFCFESVLPGFKFDVVNMDPKVHPKWRTIAPSEVLSNVGHLKIAMPNSSAEVQPQNHEYPNNGSVTLHGTGDGSGNGNGKLDMKPNGV